MHVEAEATIGRPIDEVFDHVARAEYLPEYVTQFSWVHQVGAGEPARGTSYEYKMARGQAAGTFEWTEFDRPSKLAWHGPSAKAGPGSMEPSGWWELSEEGPGTRVKLVMTPKPGGLFKLLAPLMRGQMRKGNVEALRLLKEQIELCSRKGTLYAGFVVSVSALAFIILYPRRVSLDQCGRSPQR